MCPTWHYERDALIPPNLYLAMFEKRRGEAPHPPRVFEDVPVYWPIAPVPAPAPAAAGAAAAPAGSR